MSDELESLSLPCACRWRLDLRFSRVTALWMIYNLNTRQTFCQTCCPILKCTSPSAVSSGSRPFDHNDRYVRSRYATDPSLRARGSQTYSPPMYIFLLTPVLAYVAATWFVHLEIHAWKLTLDLRRHRSALVETYLSFRLGGLLCGVGESSLGNSASGNMSVPALSQ